MFLKTVFCFEKKNRKNTLDFQFLFFVMKNTKYDILKELFLERIKMMFSMFSSTVLENRNKVLFVCLCGVVFEKSFDF